MYIYKKVAFFFTMTIFMSSLHAITTTTSTEGFAYPPPVPAGAMEACSDKNENDLCSVTTPQNEIKGTCHKRPPETGIMVCIPNYSQDLIDACKDKKEGEACAFTSQTNTPLGGSCRRGSFEGAPVVCAIGVVPNKEE
ncbi:MAG: hypothetical protein BGO43_08010 [Gammaproteobacteria bacterium 39-13]|nr:hypothetical protein [Gammaproteobacteria bacterium]OJV93112.1 MAG: hypothetical protein BGO43_08010 [Gammaproteobacteria bacterium 39-13]